MKWVMILGAGRGQIPIIDLCHKYDCNVAVVSPQGEYPGIKAADYVYYADVKDKENILQCAWEKKIKAILTDQLDAGVLTAAYVAEKLGIKGITLETALKFTNKNVMRQAAKSAGVAVPEFICIKTMDDVYAELKACPEMTFPLMMKPADGSASRGVYKVSSYSDIENKIKDSRQYSKSGEIILEQFIEGSEYVVEAFTRNYKTTNLVVGHRDYFSIKDTFIPNATVFRDAESADSELEKRLKEINRILVESFRLHFGITHGEYLYSPKEDKVYLVEIAARGGGVFISSDLIPYACGVNANDLLVREALGIDNGERITLKKGASAYFCYLVPEGEVVKLDNIDAINNLPGVKRAFFDNIELGMQTKSIKDKASRKGPILVSGATKKDCYDAIERVKEVIDIRVNTVCGEKEVIWD